MRPRAKDLRDDPEAIELAERYRHNSPRQEDGERNNAASSSNDQVIDAPRAPSAVPSTDESGRRLQSVSTLEDTASGGFPRSSRLLRYYPTVQRDQSNDQGQHATIPRPELSSESLPPLASRSGEAEMLWSRSSRRSRPSIPRLSKKLRHGYGPRWSSSRKPEHDLESGLAFNPQRHPSASSFPRLEDDDSQQGEVRTVTKMRERKLDIHTLSHDHPHHEELNESAAKQSRMIDILFIVFLIILGVAAAILSATGNLNLMAQTTGTKVEMTGAL